jgi:non-canonical purine NTP pyrophosphatase, rdgB/HAM1 family
MKIICATSNKDKLREIREIFSDFDCEIVSMKEAGVSIDVEETGDTFLENAYIKAKAVWDITGGVVFSDDSGLEVDYLNKAPGVYSARFMGTDTSYDIKNKKIIQLLEEATGGERSARYKAAICCILEDGSLIEIEESMEGEIAHSPSGSEGFGYDPIFYVKEFSKTAAALSREEKNKISHRGKALRVLKDKLRKGD